MSYGSATYGGSAYGGTANSANEQVFFPLALYSADVLREAEVQFLGSEQFYSIFTLQSSEPNTGPIGTDYKVYSANNDGETPQLQVSMQGNGQAVIGAARRIIVTMIVDPTQFPSGLGVKVTGRPGG